MTSVDANDIFEVIESLDLDVNVNDIHPDDDLADKHFDSLDIANLIFGIEDKFSITVPDNFTEDGRILSVNKIIELINSVN